MDVAGQENLRLAEEMYRKFREQDLAFFDILDPEVEFQTFFGDVHGPDAVIGYLESVGDMFEEAGPDPEEFISAGDTVIVLGTWRGRAKATGTRVEARFAHVLQFRDDRLVRHRNYVDSAKLMEALGAPPA
jgi:ketosteroid isomerase-like protein